MSYANPFLICELCGRQATDHKDNQNVPCGHHASIRSICPSWSPVDGCLCVLHLGHVPHQPLAALEAQP